MPKEQQPQQTNLPQQSTFRKEDIFLYIVCALIIGCLTYIIVDTRNVTLESFNNEIPATDFKDESLRYDVQRMYIRYHYAAKCLVSNSVRVNIGFLLGAAISLLGVILVIRQVRDTIEFGAKGGTMQDLNLKTTSPGVFITFIGAVIIMTCILARDNIDVNEGGGSGDSGGFVKDLTQKPIDISSLKKNPPAKDSTQQQDTLPHN